MSGDEKTVAGKIRIKWVRSTIGCRKDHRRTIRALGLHKLNNEVIKEASPSVLGMVRKVAYLLDVEEIS